MRDKSKILMYHSIGSNNNGEVGARLYSVPVEKFRRQMQYIAGGTAPFGDTPCLLTFDDGLIDNYTTAYPILKEFGLKAYFFILVGKIGERGYMNWEQIRELRDRGMIIGSHGMTHRILTELDDKELEDELKNSKKILEDNLYKSVDYFSVPKGFYNDKVIKKAKEIGYKAVFTSNPLDKKNFIVGRIPVKENWTLPYFRQVINNGYPFKERLKELAKNSSKKILGASRYSKMRGLILRKS